MLFLCLVCWDFANFFTNLVFIIEPIYWKPFSIFITLRVETAPASKEDKLVKYSLFLTLLHSSGRPHILPAVSRGPKKGSLLQSFRKAETKNQLKDFWVNRIMVLYQCSSLNKASPKVFNKTKLGLLTSNWQSLMKNRVRNCLSYISIKQHKMKTFSYTVLKVYSILTGGITPSVNLWLLKHGF